MATAAIRIDQPSHATQPTGVVGRARDDLELAGAITLRNGDNSGVVAWRWELLYRPTGSLASLTNPVLPTVTFTPDVEGTYRLRLTVNDGLVGEVATTVAVVRDVEGLRIPAAGETTEANFAINGAINTKGWHPDLEAYLVSLKTNTAVVYDIDFTDITPVAIADGNVVIEGKTWVAENVNAQTTTAQIGPTGLVFAHASGSSSELAGADTAPRIRIALSDLIDGYSTMSRYLFIVQWSWSVAPNQSGERFSFGIHGDPSSPSLSSSRRYVGASINYNSSGSIVVEAERDNTISGSRSLSAPIVALALDSVTEFAVFKASSWPTTIGDLAPVIAQRAQNLTAAGDYNVFSHPDNEFLFALAASGTTATHAVQIERLQIVRR